MYIKNCPSCEGLTFISTFPFGGGVVQNEGQELRGGYPMRIMLRKARKLSQASFGEQMNIKK